MSEPKFTKGPWTSSLLDYHSDDPTVIAISGSDNKGVCEILDGSVKDADLALILAAPDLYEVLADMDDAFNDHLPESRLGMLLTWVAFEKARVALRKARGEAE